MARSIEPGPAAPAPPRAAEWAAPPPPRLASRFAAFVAEPHPFALPAVWAAFRSVCPKEPPRSEAAIEALRGPFTEALTRIIAEAPPEEIAETTSGVAAEERLRRARALRHLVLEVQAARRLHRSAAGRGRPEEIPDRGGLQEGHPEPSRSSGLGTARCSRSTPT